VVASACIVVAFLAWDAAAHIPAILLGATFAGIVIRTLQECASTMRETADALHSQEAASPPQPDLISDLPEGAGSLQANQANGNGKDTWTQVAKRA